MKKSFHISLIFLLIPFFTVILGLVSSKKSIGNVYSSPNKVGVSVSESLQQHDVSFVASLTENDFDIDKTFWDVPFIIFGKNTFFWGTSFHSKPTVHCVSESVHDYHLPRYLLFHNLKITI
ncbi:hypothetical protein [Chryseobacterium sp. Mn2064]|uniref:hypothetical protein n=1 Tax=Chryseobacterium sp. Mn2064 TaxID=3395263 RepID=UPI003BBD7629